MAKEIITLKNIEVLGKRELRYTKIDGEEKYDIRTWKGDKAEDGVRFTEEELRQIYNAIVYKIEDATIGNKMLVFNEEYALQIEKNGRLFSRKFATIEEMNNLIEILKSTDCCPINYEKPKEKEINECTSKKRGRPKKNEDNTTTEEKPKVVPIQNKSRKDKTYENAYEKFKDMFSKYRSKQDENRRKGYALTHKIITDHIKDIIETSPEYNANLMQEHKNSHNMMLYIQDKAFENAECMMSMATMEDAHKYLCQWVDEYAGLDDAPKAKKEA